jgi:hypothetical protein
MRGEGGGFAWSQPMSKAVQCARGAQVNFGDLTPCIFNCYHLWDHIHLYTYILSLMYHMGLNMFVL